MNINKLPLLFYFILLILHVLKNQLGRRNLTSQEASYYRGKLYESRKLKYGGDRKSSVQNAHLEKTAEIIGKEYGVNESTIRRDAEFSKAVDKVAEKVGKEAKNYEIT